MYAHVTGGVVDIVGEPPATVFFNGRSYDLRPRDAETLAIVGWYLVTTVARPADTATNTTRAVYTFNGTTVVQSWQQIAKTPEQLAAETAGANENTLRNAAATDLTALQTSITNLNTVIAKANNSISGGDTKQVAQEARAIARATIRLIRLVTNALDTANVP